MLHTIYNFTQKNKKITIVSALLWTLIIFLGCSLPGKEIPKVNLFQHVDKVVHFTFFFFFFLLWKFSFYTQKNSSLFILIIAIALGFAIEFYQLHCVSGRSFDVWDGVADSLGAWCAYLILSKKSSPHS